MQRVEGICKRSKHKLLHFFGGFTRYVVRCYPRLIPKVADQSMLSNRSNQGWRVLVFQFGRDPSEELHVLAPLLGDEWDWDALRTFVREGSWPDYQHEHSKLTGVLQWAGHHIYVVAEGYEPQRMGTGKLVPGEFRGGVDRPLLLVEVRDAIPS